MRKLTTKQAIFFKNVVWKYYTTERRNFPWRHTHNPYYITVSEIMLQQTQADRVVPKYRAFLKRFPSWKSLALAKLSEVLSVWQGLGYNRRAKLLHLLAKTVVQDHNALLPREYHELLKLPGIGPATASAIRAFAFNLPGVYLETNVRSVYIHHFFKNKINIADNDILPLVEQTMDARSPREWNWALLDYGVYIKKTVTNPNRRSKHYVRQGRFEGSKRQLRGKIVTALLLKGSMTLVALTDFLDADRLQVREVLSSLCKDGLLLSKGKHYLLT